MARGDQDLEKVLGPLEAEVMRGVWASEGAVSVRDLVDQLNDQRSQPLAYTTVMTVMARLAEKGVLSRRREGRGYRYEATVDDAAEIAVRNVMRDFGNAAIAHFVDAARADPQALRRLERLVRDDA